MQHTSSDINHDLQVEVIHSPTSHGAGAGARCVPGSTSAADLRACFSRAGALRKVDARLGERVFTHSLMLTLLSRLAHGIHPCMHPCITHHASVRRRRDGPPSQAKKRRENASIRSAPSRPRRCSSPGAHNLRCLAMPAAKVYHHSAPTGRPS